MINAAYEIAVTLSPAVNRFWEIRRIYESEGMAVPYSVEDGWEQLMRIRDYAEKALIALAN